MAMKLNLCRLGSTVFAGFRRKSRSFSPEGSKRHKTVLARKWTLAKQWDGEPRLSDFLLIEEAVKMSSSPQEILIEAIYLSVDPYMRIENIDVGATIMGEQVARVTYSNTPRFPEGALVLANVGWRTHTAVPDPDKEELFGPVVRLLPDLGGLSPSLAVSYLGMPGMTGYFGLLDRCQPKAGETVLVSGAAGAVGSVVGQVAKIQVGGDFTYNVMSSHMNFDGRIAVCGAISQYNTWERERSVTMFIIDNQLNIRGVYVPAYKNRYLEFVEQMSLWIREGRVKCRETITDGFENMPRAFLSLFQGANIGKAVVTAGRLD